MLKRISRIIVTALVIAAPIVGIAVDPASAAQPKAISSYCGYTSSQPTLSEGSSGTAVKQAQCELNWAYAYGSSNNYGNGANGGLTVDGQFGANTLAATRAFQSCAHISVDGVIGPNTWSELNYWVNQPTYC
jgi:zinc D-Ala-D-Ala carboxypeptidase